MAGSAIGHRPCPRGGHPAGAAVATIDDDGGKAAPPLSLSLAAIATSVIGAAAASTPPLLPAGIPSMATTLARLGVRRESSIRNGQCTRAAHPDSPALSSPHHPHARLATRARHALVEGRIHGCTLHGVGGPAAAPRHPPHRPILCLKTHECVHPVDTRECAGRQGRACSRQRAWQPPGAPLPVHLAPRPPLPWPCPVPWVPAPSRRRGTRG